MCRAFSVGDRVEGYFKGKWYGARILNRKPGRPFPNATPETLPEEWYLSWDDGEKGWTTYIRAPTGEIDLPPGWVSKFLGGQSFYANQYAAQNVGKGPTEWVWTEDRPAPLPDLPPSQVSAPTTPKTHGTELPLWQPPSSELSTTS